MTEQIQAINREIPRLRAGGVSVDPRETGDGMRYEINRYMLLNHEEMLALSTGRATLQSLEAYFKSRDASSTAVVS